MSNQELGQICLMNTARTETKPGTERLAKQNDAKYLTRDWIVKEKY
jgi:hypothetical protein